MKIVEATDVTKFFNSFKALDSVSFYVEKGECFGLLGPNGAGKSTLIRVLYGFFPPDRGYVRVFGLDVVKEGPSIRQRMGIVPQEQNLDVDLSVIENLIVYASFFEIPKRKALPIARELLALFGLSEKSDLPVKALSGGMKKSLLFARALINDPELIVLDEPTLGLDPTVRKLVWERIEGLKKIGKTLILTTHYMEEAERLCDRISLMDRGRIVEIGERDRFTERYGSLDNAFMEIVGRRIESYEP